MSSREFSPEDIDLAQEILKDEKYTRFFDLVRDSVKYLKEATSSGPVLRETLEEVNYGRGLLEGIEKVFNFPKFILAEAEKQQVGEEK